MNEPNCQCIGCPKTCCENECEYCETPVVDCPQKDVDDIDVVRSERDYYRGLSKQLKGSLENASGVKVVLLKTLTFLDVLETPIGEEKETIKSYSKKLREQLAQCNF